MAKKFLDQQGLQVLWDLSKSKFQSKLFPVSEYGFDTNLRVNQVVDGKALIDAVLDAYENQKVLPVIKAGEYRFTVAEILDNSEGGDSTLAVACLGTAIDSEATNPVPYSERVIFIYNANLNKTLSFYSNDKNHVSRSEFEAQVQDLNNKINLKASQEDLNVVIESLTQLIDIVDANSNKISYLNNVAQVELELNDGFTKEDSGIRIDVSQNDFRIFLPANYGERFTEEEGLSGTLYGFIKVYPLKEDPAYFKAGDYEKYDEIFGDEPLEILVDENNRKYCRVRIPFADWDESQQKWILYTTQVTDHYYPSYGRLVEWYDADKKLLSSFSTRISLSDWAHFYNNKDWYAVADMTTGVDNNSIVYNANNKLMIKGLENATEGYMLTRNSESGVAWTKPVDDTQLQQAVANASASATTATNYAVISGNKAVEAATSAANAETTFTRLKEWAEAKFWIGTLAQYNALEKINPETIYIIEM